MDRVIKAAVSVVKHHNLYLCAKGLDINNAVGNKRTDKRNKDQLQRAWMSN